MTNPWIGWNGGDVPVHPETVVEYIMDGGDKGTDKAGELEWNDPTIGEEWLIRCYRVVKDYREPREVWVKTDEAGMSWFAWPGIEGATLFREVIE